MDTTKILSTFRLVASEFGDVDDEKVNSISNANVGRTTEFASSKEPLVQDAVIVEKESLLTEP